MGQLSQKFLKLIFRDSSLLQ